MVISKETIKKIKDIIDKYHNQLTISTLGNSVFTPEELAKLEEQGIDTSNDSSLLELVYHHNFINEHGKASAPNTVSEMQDQQSNEAILPKGEAHDYAIEHANENTKQLFDKLNTEVQTRIEGMVRDANQDYKMDALQNINRSDSDDLKVKE